MFMRCEFIVTQWWVHNHVHLDHSSNRTGKLICVCQSQRHPAARSGLPLYNYHHCVCFTQQKDTLFQQFLIAVSLEGLENKYNLELSRGQPKYRTSDIWYSWYSFPCTCLPQNMPCLLILSFFLFFLDIKILKNRKFMGSVAEQNIRTKSKPIIQEIDSKWVLHLFSGLRMVLKQVVRRSERSTLIIQLIFITRSNYWNLLSPAYDMQEKSMYILAPN